MAISAESITKSSTLEQLRTQFNNLVSDLTALEAGKAAFTEISTTTITGTAINVAEDGTIVFEGATNDDFETTLTVADPTADRTITLPNVSGIVVVSGDGGFTVADGGTIGSTTTTDAITIASNGNITLSGDLTISGDDLFMGTNTAGLLLIADGTNFNPTAVTSLTAISSGDIVSGTDVLMIQDVDAGALKKVTVDNVFSSVGGLASLAGDSTPQLGGDLDVNSNDIVSTSNGNINLLPNGTGKVIMDGNGSSGGVSITDGVIDIRTGTGNRSKILFYCESSNAHAQTLQAAPHSEAASNTLTLPSTGGSVDLVSTASTATLTNKTLTTPKIVDDGYIQFGTDSEVRLISNPDKGLILKHTATADDKPVSLTLQTGETDIAADDVIGKLDFQAPDEGTGTDAILVAAGIEAVSEGDFSSSSNATKLVFKTAASEAASEKMSLSSAGLLTVADDIVFKDGGTIGVTSATDAMTVSSGGIVRFKDDILIKDGGTIGSASDADAITIASNGVVTFSQNPVFPDGSVPLDDLDIDGGTDIGAALSTSDLIIVDDGAGGTNRKAALSRVVTLMTAQGFSTEDPTALAIALG